MRKFYLSLLSVSLLVANSHLLFASGTFTQIHQILQTKCAASGCHDGSDNTFNLSLSDAGLYAQLVNATPKNHYADSIGNKLIQPGYVARSFFLRKVASGLNENVVQMKLKTPEEGNDYGTGASSLAKNEIELIRQWILYAAPLNGTVVDTAMINTYYRGKGKEDTYATHAVPAPGTGFQIYVGKLFIPANSENYYFIKQKLYLTSNIEIPHVETFMPQSTHHFVIYKFQPGGDANYVEGLRDTTGDSHADVLDGIGTGEGYWEYNLPTGCAYIWPQNTVLDLNLHIRNSYTDTVLACDMYVNIYTQPTGTAQHLMLIRNYPVFDISIPQDGAEHSFTDVANDTTETNYWRVWQLYSHTHKYGTNYDIWLRTATGDTGRRIYDGLYSYEDGGLYIGYYRWGVHVTFEYFGDNYDSLLQVDPRLGFIHTATYLNTNGPNPILWGNTSSEEMMVMGFQYVYGDPLPPLQTSTKDISKEAVKLNVFPNPVSDEIALNYVLEHSSDIKVELTNVLGETTTVLEQKQKPVGNYLDKIILNGKYAPGVYLLTFNAANTSNTQRIVIQ